MSDDSGGEDREPRDDGSSRSDEPADPSVPDDHETEGDPDPDDARDRAPDGDPDANETNANAGGDDVAPESGDPDAGGVEPNDDSSSSEEPHDDSSDSEPPDDETTGGLEKVDEDTGDPRPDEPAKRSEATAPDDEDPADSGGLENVGGSAGDPRPEEPSRRFEGDPPGDHPRDGPPEPPDQPGGSEGSEGNDHDDDPWGTHGFDARSPEDIREEAMGPSPEEFGPDGDSDPEPAPPSAAEAQSGGPAGTPDPTPGAGLMTPEAESTGTEYDVPDPFSGDEGQQPPDDEEMPLAVHIEEMVKRLAVVIAAVAVATAFAFPFATEVINAMWYGLLPPDTPAPHVYGPLEKVLSEIKVASLAGILVALPILVYEAYLFMRPGLYPKERRYFLAAVPTSLVLGVIGMAFAYFLVLPVLFDYFVLYSESGVDKLAFGLRVTFDLIVALLGAFAIVFQIPLLIMLAVMMGVTTRRWLEARRLYFWAGFLGVGFLMGGADITGMAPLVIAATMIGLFEGTLGLLRWTQR
jgi:sec-independent protein translocase protein TatC